MKITELKCAVLGRNPVVRVVTDAGIDGYAAAESWKPYLKPHVLALADALLGQDPTDVERVVLRITNMQNATLKRLKAGCEPAREREALASSLRGGRNPRPR